MKKIITLLSFTTVLFISCGKEKKVKQYLEAEINSLGINNLVPQILIPTEKVFQIRNGFNFFERKIFNSSLQHP